TSVKPRRLLVFGKQSMAASSPTSLRRKRRKQLPWLTLPAGNCRPVSGLTPPTRDWLFPPSGVPTPDFPPALVTTAGGQAPAVWAERHAPHVTDMAPEGAEFLARRRVVKSYILVLANCGESSAVRAERHAEDPDAMLERELLRAGRHVPDAHDPVAPGCR